MAKFWTGSASKVSKYQEHMLCSGLRMKTSPLSVPVPEVLGRSICNKEQKSHHEQGVEQNIKIPEMVYLLCMSYSKSPQNRKNKNRPSLEN